MPHRGRPPVGEHGARRSISRPNAVCGTNSNENERPFGIASTFAWKLLLNGKPQSNGDVRRNSWPSVLDTNVNVPGCGAPSERFQKPVSATLPSKSISKPG